MNARGTALKDNLTKSIPLLLLIAMIIIFGASINNFLSAGNIQNILSSFSVYGVVAVAMTFAIICGEFDLSVGSIMALSSLVYANLIDKTPIVVAMLAALFVGALIGALNGLIIAKFKVSSFVATMGMQITVKGAALYYTDAKPTPIYNELSYEIGNGSVAGIPYLVLFFFLMLAIGWFVLKYTAFGRGVYAVGGNMSIARYAGIKVDFYKFMVFFILGVAAALGGIMMACRIAAGNALYGADLTMTAISAVVVGGTSLIGGNGGVLRTLLGLVILYVLFNALTLLGIQAYVQQLIKGLIVIFVVVADSVIRISNEK